MFLTGTLVLLNSYALSFNDYSYMYYLYIIIIWRRHRCNKAHFCLNFDLPYGYLHVTLLDPTLLYKLWQQGFNDTLTNFGDTFFGLIQCRQLLQRSSFMLVPIGLTAFIKFGIIL